MIVRMQAMSEEAGPLPEVDGEVPTGLTLVVNTGLGMSSGKTIAQIGHAALMVGLDSDLELRVIGASGAAWATLAASATAVVRDGGLTEITPGSETVLILQHESSGG